MNSKHYLKHVVHVTKNGLLVNARKLNKSLWHYGKNQSERVVEKLRIPLTERVQESVRFLDNTLGVSEVGFCI